MGYHLFLLINLTVPLASTQDKNFKNRTSFQRIAWGWSVRKKQANLGSDNFFATMIGELFCRS